MTLSEALVVMAPLDPMLPSEENHRREVATEVVYKALREIAARRNMGDDAGDFVQDVLIRLCKNRPGAGRYTADDDGARAYLSVALDNQRLDGHRRVSRYRRRFVPIVETAESGKERDDRRHDVDTSRKPDGPLMADERARLIAEATRQLFERAIPAIATSLQNPTGFLANITDLRAIFHDALTVGDIVRREGGTDDTYVTVRNRVYQRHKRARAYLLEVPRNRPDDVPRLSAWLTRAGLAPELADEVRRVANAVFAPRVDRGESSPQEQVS